MGAQPAQAAKSDAEIQIGIGKKERERIATHLSRVLADTYMLYLKTHFYHWNVTGPLFASLHVLLEKQYGQLFEATDVLAERVRALGFFAPGSISVFGSMTVIEDDGNTVPDAMKMIDNLVKGHEAIARTTRAAFKAANEAEDQATMDILVDRMKESDMAAWMLRSHLEKASSEMLPREVLAAAE
jgi:starvation-inducible DNA-binding protein